MGRCRAGVLFNGPGQDKALELHGGDLVFCQGNGRPLQPEMVTRRFNKLVADAGLPKTRLHDLRHVCASMLIHAKVPLFRVSRSLEHSSPSIMANMHGWLVETCDAW